MVKTEEDKQNMMVDGVNADMLYANVANYLTLLATKMRKKHRQRTLEERPITKDEIAKLKREIQQVNEILQ